MKTLASLQGAFKAYVVDSKDQVFDDIEQTETLGKQLRLDIYANAYHARLQEALDVDYPVLHTMLGDEAFDQLTLAYIAKHPSSHPSLRWFGQYLSNFLRVDGTYNLHGFLAEMADFEWVLRTAFDAQNSAVATEEDAALLPAEAWANMRPVPVHSAQLLTIQWNTPLVWRSVNEKLASPVQPEKLTESLTCLIWRRELITRYRVMEQRDEAIAVELLLEGKNFSNLCEELCDEHGPEHAPMRAVSLLKAWLNEGVIAELQY